MALMSVNVNGQVFVVDAASKAAARAFGHTKVSVEVSEATGAQITEFVKNGGEIAVVEKKTKEAKKEEAAAE